MWIKVENPLAMTGNVIKRLAKRYHCLSQYGKEILDFVKCPISKIGYTHRNITRLMQSLDIS
jgi:hypothetical protein